MEMTAIATMKNYIILMLAMLVASPAFSQKKEKESVPDTLKTTTDTLKATADTVKPQAAAPAPTAGPLSPEVDSLAEANKALADKLSAVYKDLEVYKGMYTAIKEKVLKQDFDPARTAMIIDSLASRRDSSFAQMGMLILMKDTLISLRQEHIALKARLENYQTEEAAKGRMVAELKQLKELLDAKILTQSEFDIKKTLVLRKWE
jgi:hypothetical protein